MKLCSKYRPAADSWGDKEVLHWMSLLERWEFIPMQRHGGGRTEDIKWIEVGYQWSYVNELAMNV